MSAISKALRADLAMLTFRRANMLEPSPFSPPYIMVGLYAIENRKRLEAPNRETIKSLFTRMAKEKRDADMWRRRKELHDQGMHWPGYCPWCPPNVFYD